MAVLVDPPQLPIPTKWLQDPEVGPFIIQLVNCVIGLWRRTGQDQDSISNLDTAELYSWGSGSKGGSAEDQKGTYQFTAGEQSYQIPDFVQVREEKDHYIFTATPEEKALYSFTATQEEKPAYLFTQTPPQIPFFSVSANHTCRGNEVVEATSNITVYLDANPEDTGRITVKRNTAAGAVTVDGNGNNIDGAATLSLATNYDGYDFVFSPTSGEWLKIG